MEDMEDMEELAGGAMVVDAIEVVGSIEGIDIPEDMTMVIVAGADAGAGRVDGESDVEVERCTRAGDVVRTMSVGGCRRLVLGSLRRSVQSDFRDQIGR